MKKFILMMIGIFFLTFCIFSPATHAGHNQNSCVVQCPNGPVLSVTFTLPDAQIKALPTDHFELVPAPGVGKALMFLFGVFHLKATGGAYTNLHSLNGIFVTNGGDTQVSFAPPPGFLADGPFEYISPVPIADDGSGYAGYFTPGHFNNKNLTLQAFNGALGNFMGGDSTNTLTVTIYYVVVDVQ